MITRCNNVFPELFSGANTNPPPPTWSQVNHTHIENPRFLENPWIFISTTREREKERALADFWFLLLEGLLWMVNKYDRKFDKTRFFSNI